MKGIIPDGVDHDEYLIEKIDGPMIVIGVHGPLGMIVEEVHLKPLKMARRSDDGDGAGTSSVSE